AVSPSYDSPPETTGIILLICCGLSFSFDLDSHRSFFHGHPAPGLCCPGPPALASSVLAPLHWIMPPLYSLSDLHSFNNRLPPDCMDILADNEILRKRRPPHRGSG
ncbi:hypothetical protein KUCAC02_000087, partial [Chaenocephalus aceratus]